MKLVECIVNCCIFIIKIEFRHQNTSGGGGGGSVVNL